MKLDAGQLLFCCCRSEQFMKLDAGQLLFCCCHSEQFMKLDAGQFAALLQENSLRIASEYALFDFVLKWLRYDRAAREQHTAQLIERIRLPLLSGEELVEKVRHRRAPRRRHLLQLVVSMYRTNAAVRAACQHVHFFDCVNYSRRL